MSLPYPNHPTEIRGETIPSLRLPIYLFDTDCIVNLDKKGRRPQIVFTDTERIQVWDGIEKLAANGRLKLIRHVRTELKRHNPEGLKRISYYKRTTLPIRTTTPHAVREFQELVRKYKAISPTNFRPEKADVWLLIASRRHGYTIVTDERRIDEREGRATNEPRLADITTLEGLTPAMHLREVANHEGWI